MKFDHNIPLPIDTLSDYELKMSDYTNWIPNKLFKDTKLTKFKFFEDDCRKRYELRKRMYIFIVATNHYNVNEFELHNMFDMKYQQSILDQNCEKKTTDYLSLCNALLLMQALKKNERIFREVYVLGESMKNIES